MVTTSSCSGRVSIFLEGVKTNNSTSVVAKGHEGRWLFVTHEPKDLNNWYDSIDFNYDTSKFPENASARSILYKFEPLILHVKCRNESMAQKLYVLAMNNGFRESGIGNNFNVAIRINIKLDIPIGFQNVDEEDLNCFVTKEYLKYITDISHERFNENFKKLEQLHRAIERMIEDETKGIETTKKKHKESKEERRQRMIKEGLQRQQELRELKEKQQQEQNETLHVDK